jgi:hypothetical protein
MSNEIIKVLDAICDKFGLAIDWTSQNVMPYVEQLCEHIVQYELVSSSIYTVLSLVILIVGTVLCIRMFKKIFKSSLYEFDKVGAYSCTIFLLVVIYLIFFPILITQFEDAITSLTFPEKTIIEFFSQYTQK